MFTRLIESLASTEPISAIFSDQAVLQSMLDFESALARAEAGLGIIPRAAAEVITRAAVASNFNIDDLAHQAFRAGTPAIPLVRMLTAKVRELDTEAAGYVHWGATSQDVVDTALVLLLGRCRQILEADHVRIVAALNRLSDEHAGTVMLGRTLLQPAPPITFGLKAAGWLGAVERGWVRVDSRFDQSAYLQFGGASGTLAALEDRGLAVSEALATELALKCPDAPWHGHRDRLAALMAATSIYTASLGKMALDISLLMQYEVAEAAEPGGEGRGGSSTMPHKRNPTACMLAIAAAKRTPGLLANFVAGMLTEHERAVGSWQSEWATVEGIMQAVGVAAASMAEVAEGLTVDPARMLRNIEATDGAVFSEKAMMQLAPEIGREEAYRQVAESLPDLPGLRDPADYLGSAEVFRQRQGKVKTDDPIQAGFAVRRAVLGDAHVERAIAATTDLTRDFQDLITRYAWGTVWTRPGLDHRTRRLLVLAMTASLGRWEEFRLHAAHVEADDLKEVLLMVAVYAGVPAANTAFKLSGAGSQPAEASQADKTTTS